MADFEDAYRQRRRRGFWRKLKNARTLRIVLEVAWGVYRILRWVIDG